MNYFDRHGDDQCGDEIRDYGRCRHQDERHSEDAPCDREDCPVVRDHQHVGRTVVVR